MTSDKHEYEKAMIAAQLSGEAMVECPLCVTVWRPIPGCHMCHGTLRVTEAVEEGYWESLEWP